MKFKVEHYDDTVTEHDTIAEALIEATRRLEPWREGTDFVFPKSIKDGRFNNIEKHSVSVFVCNDRWEATDAESYISVLK